MSNWTNLRDSITAMDVPEAIQARLQTLIGYYEVLGFDAFDSFLSETIEDDGGRRFISLWLFNGEASMEADLGESEGDQLDGVRIRGHLQRWAVRSRNYDFATAVTESRLNVQLWYTDELWGELSATGANCDRLRDLLKKHVVPETGAGTSREGSALTSPA